MPSLPKHTFTQTVELFVPGETEKNEKWSETHAGKGGNVTDKRTGAVHTCVHNDIVTSDSSGHDASFKTEFILWKKDWAPKSVPVHTSRDAKNI